MKPLTRIEIENFQSIKDLSLDLDGNGFYWIKGKNNIGKSALIKAISFLFTNVSNNQYKEYIRDNEQYFKITGHFDDDIVTLSRGSMDYYAWKINGQFNRIDKTKGKVPEELIQYFNLYYEPEKTKRYLNITNTGDPLLFVETTGGDNVQLIQKALGTETLNKAEREAKKRARQAKQEQNTYVTLKDEQLELIEPKEKEFTENNETIEYLDQLNRTLQTEYKIYDTLKSSYQTVENVFVLGSHLVDIHDKLNTFESYNLEKEFELLGILEELYRKQKQLKRLKQQLSQIPEFPEKITTMETDILLVDLLKETLLLEKEHQEKTELLEHIPEISDGDVIEVKNLQEMIKILTHTKQTINSYILNLGQRENINNELDNLEQEFKTFKTCPYCLQEINHGGDHSEI